MADEESRVLYLYDWLLIGVVYFWVTEEKHKHSCFLWCLFLPFLITRAPRWFQLVFCFFYLTCVCLFLSYEYVVCDLTHLCVCVIALHAIFVALHHKHSLEYVLPYKVCVPGSKGMLCVTKEGAWSAWERHRERVRRRKRELWPWTKREREREGRELEDVVWVAFLFVLFFHNPFKSFCCVARPGSTGFTF